MKKTQEQLLNEELNRFLSINKYVGTISEQEAEIPAEDEGTSELDMELPEPSVDTEVPAEDGAEVSEVPTEETPSEEPEMALDGVESELENVEEPTEDTEEVDVTDLVTGQKELEGKFKDTEEKITQSVEKVEGVFSKLDDLESKIAELDKLYGAIDTLGQKIDQAKPKTPEEKLELRSLDSYPFNQKLTDFFQDKEGEMEITGKNEYVLTSDDVKNMSQNDVRNSFTVKNQD